MITKGLYSFQSGRRIDTAVNEHKLLIQFSLRYKNWYDSKWPQMADIVFNQMQELIRQGKNTNCWNSFHSDTRIDTTVNEHKRLICFSLRYKTRLDTAMNEHMSLSLLLAVPGGWVYFRFLAGFMVVSLFLCRSWFVLLFFLYCS